MDSLSLIYAVAQTTGDGEKQVRAQIRNCPVGQGCGDPREKKLPRAEAGEFVCDAPGEG